MVASIVLLHITFTCKRFTTNITGIVLEISIVKHAIANRSCFNLMKSLNSLIHEKINFPRILLKEVICDVWKLNWECSIVEKIFRIQLGHIKRHCMSQMNPYKFLSIIHSQFNYHTLPITPFKRGFKKQRHNNWGLSF